MAFRSPLLDIPGDLIKTVARTFNFDGRATRTEVWTYFIVGNFLAAIASGSLEFAFGEEKGFRQATLGVSIATLAFLAPYSALMARRLQDFGTTGWLAALFIPLFALAALTESATPRLIWVEKTISGWLPSFIIAIGVLASFAIALIPPERTENRFGPDPRVAPKT